MIWLSTTLKRQVQRPHDLSACVRRRGDWPHRGVRRRRAVRAAPCDRGGMETELGGDAGVAAIVQFQRGESGEEPSLLLVESAEIELVGFGQFWVDR